MHEVSEELEERGGELNFGKYEETLLAVSFAGMHADVPKNTIFKKHSLYLCLIWKSGQINYEIKFMLSSSLWAYLPAIIFR